MYRSISGGPGQGPGLVNWLVMGDTQTAMATGGSHLHLLGPAMIAVELEAWTQCWSRLEAEGEVMLEVM